MHTKWIGVDMLAYLLALCLYVMFFTLYHDQNLNFASDYSQIQTRSIIVSPKME